MVPRPGMKNLIFLSTIFFAFGGCESGSFMGDEIREPRRVIPRSLFIAGLFSWWVYCRNTVVACRAARRKHQRSRRIYDGSRSAGSTDRPGLVVAAHRGAGGREQHWRGQRVSLVDCASAVCGRRASLSSSGVRQRSSAFRHAACGDHVVWRCGNSFRLAGPGGHEHQRRLRHAGEHGGHHLLHSLSVSVCFGGSAAVHSRCRGRRFVCRAASARLFRWRASGFYRRRAR